MIICSNPIPFLFIRVPKTASTSIEHTLLIHQDEILKKYLQHGIHGNPGKMNKSHITANTVKNILGKDLYDRFFSFAFVRNSFARMASWFSYSRKNDDILMNYKFQYDEITDLQKIFEMFLIQFYDIRPFYFNQKNWIYDNSGKRLVNYIGNYATLKKDFDKICNIIKLPIADLPHLMVINGNKCEKFYNNKTIKMVNKMCSDEIKFFGFRFGE